MYDTDLTQTLDISLVPPPSSLILPGLPLQLCLVSLFLNYFANLCLGHMNTSPDYVNNLLYFIQVPAALSALQ